MRWGLCLSRVAVPAGSLAPGCSGGLRRGAAALTAALGVGGGDGMGLQAGPWRTWAARGGAASGAHRRGMKQWGALVSESGCAGFELFWGSWWESLASLGKQFRLW